MCGCEEAGGQGGADLSVHELSAGDLVASGDAPSAGDGGGLEDAQAGNGNDMQPCSGLACGPWVFAAPATYKLPPGMGWRELTSGDLDGDGRPDIAASAGGALHVLFTQPGGGLAAPLKLVAGKTAHQVGIADFDGDGRGDLVTTTSDGVPDNGFALFLNQGSRKFGSAVRIPAGGYNGFDVADVNRDGRPDLVVGDGDPRVWVVLNEGSGKFAMPRSIPSLAPLVSDPLLRDVDGDGQMDVVTTTRANPNYKEGGFVVLYLDAKLQAAATSHRPVDVRVSVFDVGDVDGDGRADIAVGGLSDNGRRNVLFLNQGGRDKWLRVDYPGEADGPRLAHLDQGGRLDMIESSCETLRLRRNEGGGNLVLRQLLPIAPFCARAYLVTDLDGDKRPDIVFGAERAPEDFSTIGVLLNRTP